MLVTFCVHTQSIWYVSKKEMRGCEEDDKEVYSKRKRERDCVGKHFVLTESNRSWLIFTALSIHCFVLHFLFGLSMAVLNLIQITPENSN